MGRDSTWDRTRHDGSLFSSWMGRDGTWDRIENNGSLFSSWMGTWIRTWDMKDHDGSVVVMDGKS